MQTPLVISPEILKKLDVKHNVSRREIEQCFENKTGSYLADDREEHKTNPPTLWFLAKTNCNRLLKVIFVFEDGSIFIKSAYQPSANVIDIYERFGK